MILTDHTNSLNEWQLESSSEKIRVIWGTQDLWLFTICFLWIVNFLPFSHSAGSNML